MRVLIPGHGWQDSLMGQDVTLRDGRAGRVTFETWGAVEHPDGMLPAAHRLLVAIQRPTCPTCPHAALVPNQVMQVLASEVLVA